MYYRKQNFTDLGQESAFLWGARQTGKSTLLKSQFPDAKVIDLLLSTDYNRLLSRPSQLREIVEALPPHTLIIIDEIQRIPELLNEVHWMIVNQGRQFILSGSSPRRILRSGGNLLGGRAYRYELYPLVFPEIPEFDLIRALNHGLLPRHYDSSNPSKMISAYIGNYLRDEIIAEARIRNIASFSRFLEVAAMTNGEIANYANIASDCGVSAPTIREYFQILNDTLIGRFLPSFQKRPKRRVIQSPKFWLFDVGIANYLVKRGWVQPGSESFGKAFEHFIYQELVAYSHYSGLDYPLYYWRTASQLEIDFVLGDHEVAIEVKSTDNAQSRHLNGLKYFSEEYSTRSQILVTLDPMPRKVGSVRILPWQDFLAELWSGNIIH